MRRIKNFGRNLEFTPAHRLAPTSVEEVLAILDEHRGKNFRAIGALHSWSDAPREEAVVLDMRHFEEVRVEQRGDETWAVIGAGCRIKHAVAVLDRQGLSLPTLGLITEQSIAGAAATGTHGSGRHSISHYVDEVTFAHFDPASGEPTVARISEPNTLRTARCSLGCLGIVLSVGIRARAQYQVEEHFRLHDQLQPVLDAEREYPLQQFYLLPHVWKYLVQHRCETSRRRSYLAPLYQVYWYLCVDLGLHACLLLLARILKIRRLIEFFYRHVALNTVIRNWYVVDKSPRILTMEHELFRHIEIEMFVRGDHLPAALDFTKALLQYAMGLGELQADWLVQARELGVADGLEQLRGAYVHHYPICVRKVLADDTTLSMASSEQQPYYALSFISYVWPSDRAGFLLFAQVLSHLAARMFGARPHWGKVCPVDHNMVAQLYPELGAFRECCRRFDPDGAFTNDWARQTIFREAAESPGSE